MVLVVSRHAAGQSCARVESNAARDRALRERAGDNNAAEPRARRDTSVAHPPGDVRSSRMHAVHMDDAQR